MLLLIRHAPVDVGGGGLAAHNALALGAGLLQRHAAAGHTGLLLHGQLALQTAAPLGTGEAALALRHLLDLLPGGHVEGVVLQILGGHGVQVVVDVLQQLLHGALQLRQRHKGLLAGIAATTRHSQEH